jgi:hypothetical protein
VPKAKAPKRLDHIWFGLQSALRLAYIRYKRMSASSAAQLPEADLSMLGGTLLLTLPFTQSGLRTSRQIASPYASVVRFPTMNNGLDALLGDTLAVKAGERLAFIYDQTFAPLVDSLHLYCAEHGVQFRSFLTDYDGLGPLSPILREVILGSQYSVIVFGVVPNIWHTPERKHAKYELGKRLASIVCSPGRLPRAAHASSIPKIASATRQLSALLSPGVTVRITSPGGSEFTARVGTPFCEHGEYQNPGTGGDFPAGEAGFGPQELSVNGRIVYDAKVQHIGLLESPLVLTVQNDRVIEVSGTARQEFLNLCAAKGEVLRYISEVSLGLNPLVGITPEPAFIPEEKTYGTAHCGHGGNASYGRRTGAHIDGIITAPTVEINGQCVMESGRLLSGVVQEEILDWLENTNASR